MSSGLIAGNIADEDKPFADGYATWASGIITVPGSEIGDETEEYVPVVPVGIAPTYPETITTPQDEIQDGDTTIPDPSETTGALSTIISWLQSIWSAICSIPGTIVDAITNVYDGVISLSDFFTATSFVESPLTAIHFGKLFDLFPFNIPYGIYQAINFWNSSAVAPTIVIPLPTYNNGVVDVYEYEIKLSDIPGMDELAALIRAGELILFAVGLLMITRKVTKW